jgi:nucleoside-diphosphate-sugar epimerase
MRNVLLTGARGFIGSHCLETLLERGFTVHAVSARSRPESYSGQVEWHHADLHNAEQVLRLMAEVKPHYLLHLAWDVTHGVYWSSLENLRWVKTSLSLLQAFINSGGKRALMVGSCAEYDWKYGYCTEELTPLKPATLYGVCKDALHRVSAAAARESGLSLAWARPFFLFGPGEHDNRLVPVVISSLLKGEEALCTHGEQIRDYMYVRDAARALAMLLDSVTEGAVNIASGQPVALKILIETAAELVGRPKLVRLGAIAAPADDQALLLANTARLNREVGFESKYSLREGLKETIKYKQQA